jgi:hypothetical protein
MHPKFLSEKVLFLFKHCRFTPKNQYLVSPALTSPNIKHHPDFSASTMGSIQETRKLFTPLRIGNMQLSHRIIMAPITRKRCPAGIPGRWVAEYYAQRATKGGLLISEGMMPSVMVRPPFLIPLKRLREGGYGKREFGEGLTI